MIVLMIINALLGFIAHYFKDHITGHMSNDWEELTNKVLGVLYVFPLSLIMFSWLKDDIKKPDLRFLIAYFLSFSSFGLGVIVGYWYYPSKKKE